MHKHLNLLMILLVICLVVACKNEGNTDFYKQESSEGVDGNREVKRIEKRELTPVEKEKANSVMSRLVIIPESKKIARYFINANMVDKLSSEKGPFTIFAPSTVIIEGLPLEKKAFYSDHNNFLALQNLLNSHIVEGNYDIESLRNIIKNKGKARLKTLAGTTLTITESDGVFVISDEKGGKAKVIKNDIQASNGQVFIIDGLLSLP